MTGDEFDMLCGYAPTSSIMSNDQMTSASCGPVSFSSVTGPVVLAVAEAVDVEAPHTPRLLT